LVGPSGPNIATITCPPGLTARDCRTCATRSRWSIRKWHTARSCHTSNDGCGARTSSQRRIASRRYQVALAASSAAEDRSSTDTFRYPPSTRSSASLDWPPPASMAVASRWGAAASITPSERARVGTYQLTFVALLVRYTQLPMMLRVHPKRSAPASSVRDPGFEPTPARETQPPGSRVHPSSYAQEGVLRPVERVSGVENALDAASSQAAPDCA